MSDIFEPSSSFPFDKLVLSNPISRSGGSYFIRFSINNEPVYIQPPKCLSRNGVVNTNRKFLIDLMFTNDNGDFINWFENLEEVCHKQIYKSREDWFEGDLELSDIENYFTSPIKLYKSGKYYLVRADIPSALGKPQLTIYDEHENEVDITDILQENELMTVLEIQGIKCGARSFQIIIEIKQMMKLEKKNLFSKCILKPSSHLGNSPDTTIPFIENKIPETVEIVPCVNNLEKTMTETQIVEDNQEHEVIIQNNDETINIEIKEHPVTNIEDTTDTYLTTENTDTEDECDNNNVATEPHENEDQDQDNDLEQCEDFSNILEEIELFPNEEDTFEISERKDVYYKMYKDTRKKAKLAKELALASYLEARKIKNTYMLESIEDSDDSDEEM